MDEEIVHGWGIGSMDENCGRISSSMSKLLTALMFQPISCPWMRDFVRDQLPTAQACLCELQKLRQ